MRALEILQKKLAPALGFMHSKRRDALWRIVEGLLRGQELWLTELGRSLPGACSIKHRIKAVDRVLGSSTMQRQIPRVCVTHERPVREASKERSSPPSDQ
jgi:hypothetical protein